MKGVTARPATLSDFRNFYGINPDRTLRAIVVETDEGVVGIGGYWLQNEAAVAFSDIKDCMNKRHIVLAAHHLADFLKQTGLRIVAPPGSTFGDTAMKHFGFEKVGDFYELTRP
jgi:hypothetical protein